MHNRHPSNKRRSLEDWPDLLANFSQQPTWEQYFTLRKQILRIRSHPKGFNKNETLDLLDMGILPLCRDKALIQQAQQIMALGLTEGEFEDQWRNNAFKEFCQHVVQTIWNLTSRPGYKLVLEIAKDQADIPDDLQQAFAKLQAGESFDALSNHVAQSLLIWLQAKHNRQWPIKKQIGMVQQSLAEEDDSQTLIDWNELVQLLSARKRGGRGTRGRRPQSDDQTASTRPKPTETETEIVADLLAPVLTGWVQTTAEFAALYQAQAGELVQRDDFITLLQQQLDDASDNKRQAQENAEAQIKQQMMAFMAEPLTMLQQAADNDANTNQLRLVYQSFEQALAELQIFPIGEIGRQFEVGPEDMVRPEDGQPISGCQVEQVSLGWQLRLNANNTRPLVRPTVRRVGDT